jgi:two-component system sensor histidine kinase KdpD
MKYQISPISLAYRVFISIILVMLLTWLLVSFQSYLSTPVIALLFLFPVVLAASYFNMAGGISASFAAFLSFNYFFIPPLHAFSVHQTQDLFALIVFLLVAVMISQSLSQAKEGVAIAVARERETTLLYELNVALAGLMSEEEILKTVSEKIIEHFPVQFVSIYFVRKDSLTQKAEYPENSEKPKRKPEYSLNLRSGSDTSGEINVWSEEMLSQPLERLLKAYASQATLVLVRSNLANAENRARLLEESDKLKSTLLSSVSHELRSPLSTIKASVSSLRSGEIDWDTEARQELLTAMEEESDHLNQLVGNLLDMSRIEMGALIPNLKNQSLREILSGTLRRMRQQLSTHIPEKFSLVYVDYGQIEQVFANLLSNSAKYAPDGTEIAISVSQISGNMVKVQVINQGPPVATEHLTRIFDKFYRVTDADLVTGTGLGLSICKGIVEAHGGKIWAENSSEGFKFNFTIPCSKISDFTEEPESGELK